MNARTLVLGALALALATPALAEWGTLRGRFVVDGEPAELEPIVVEKDAFCQKCQPKNETVVVGKQQRLANAVVYLRPRRGEEIEPHPSYAAAVAKPVELANKQCRFTPRITLLRTGQELIVKNVDPTAHNTKFDLLNNEHAPNDIIPAEGQVTRTFAEAERLPLPVSCSIHPYMRGYVLIRDDPYMAVSDKEGVFEIKNLPAGEHQFQLWHETGYLKAAEFGAGVADRRGRVRLTIPAGGELDLGDIRVSADTLAP